MESKDKLKEIDSKNRTCYYFDDIIRFCGKDTEFSDILLDKKSYETSENILRYDISYKTSTGVKTLRIRFNKIDGFAKIHNKIRYLVLFDYIYCDKICDKIKNLISEKVVLQIVLTIILEESKLICMTFYLLKKY